LLSSTQQSTLQSSQQSSSQQSTLQPTQSSSQQSLPIQFSQSFSSQQPPPIPPIVIDDNTEIEIIRRSRSHTPVLPHDITSPTRSHTPVLPPDITSPTRSHMSVLSHNITSPTSPIASSHKRSKPSANTNIEGMLVKQGKQIRALYEMQKNILEKVSWIQNQIKKSNSKSSSLSLKVFSVSNN
jgi:hypothetical protein